jgi:DNA-binding winged helix-turn-helix (wHTH) protein
VRDSTEPGLGFHPSARRIVHFGPFRADLSDGSLWRDSEEVRLPPRALALLLYLVERPGRVVSKSELVDAVWKEANVGERSLTEAMGLVRQALGDIPEQPTYIQTVHRRGYRFIAPLKRETSAAAEPVTADSIPGPAPRQRRGVLVIPALVTIGIAGAAAAWWLWTDRSDELPVMRATITLPAAQAPAPALSAHTVMALSPDGKEMVYVAGTSGSYQLFLRRMNQFEARPLPGTAGGHGPFFSPDGTRVGFFANGKLMHLPLSGGDPITVADAPAGLGAWWTDRQTIIFAPELSGGVWEVDAAGGRAVEIVRAPAATIGYRWPQALPDGRTIIATRMGADRRNATLVALTREGSQTELVKGGIYGRYLPGGHLLFVRESTLYAASYATGRASPGSERVVLERLMVGSAGAPQYSLSRGGALIYIPDEPDRAQRSIAVIDVAGRSLNAAFEPRAFQNLSICGERVAVTIAEGSTSDIWLSNVGGGPFTRLTSSGVAVEPVWKPGCREIAYSAHNAMFVQRTDGSGPPQRLLSAEQLQAPASWSPDGSKVAYIEFNPATRADLWVLNVADARRRPVAVSPANELAARISPDGRWLAYQSNETGRPEVYVRPFDRDGERVQISAAGGTAPGWSHDSERLYYRSGSRIHGVQMDRERGPDPLKSAAVLDQPSMVLFKPLTTRPGFVVIQRIREHLPLTTLNLVVNWMSELENK